MIAYEDIIAAKTRIGAEALRTPLLHSPFLDEIAGRPLYVKPECLQRTGSFKLRGAWSAISAIPDAVRASGVIAYSSGNHAQGVAYAAKAHGVPAVIIMPADAPKLKIDNTRAYGAEVVLYDRYTEDRDAIGDRLAEERNLSLVKPFDDERVIAGQGTVGLEIAEQADELGLDSASVLVPCGGGGLTSGIAIALERIAPGLVVRPCEPEDFDDTSRSLLAREILANASGGKTICDAIMTPQPGNLTFPHLSRLCGPGIVVTEDEVLRAMGLAFQRLKIAIEPGGAVGLAAALFHGEELDTPAVIAVASGGNVDEDMFSRAL
ncbi:threonine ammonia-lyase [Rhizobium halophytocola]|uniref:Threonine dehydratase n=1 Tax=Rhizobium halophytocola TaxID=735519 RepID=A0ABS4E0W9_9HYPH|nr:threonine/serine dehydratase [Rhizobium halophytocola]MBP1851590.1 threonine dehydratase [Rhizobium halophytocola]